MMSCKLLTALLHHQISELDIALSPLLVGSSLAYEQADCAS